VTRIQRLMLALLPHYDPSDELVRLLRSSSSDEKTFRAAFGHVLEINANVMTFARNVVCKSSAGGPNRGRDAKYTRIVFTPSLVEAEQKHDYDGELDFHSKDLISAFP
jgi:hypothetical protein